MQNSIEVNNLVKRYRKADTNAVGGVSFSVKEGEFFAFLGPNGAGKTTTISILTTTLAKSSGEAMVAGFDVERSADRVRRRIGVIFQAPSLDKNLSAEENIRFHVSLYGLFPFRPFYSLMPRAYKERVRELADIVGIRDALFDPITTYSGGMKRKLEIVRSLMHRPQVLFLDEPTTGLDPLSRRNVWEYLRRVRKSEHTTIFLTTHYLEEAEEADHLCVMNNGVIVARGTPAEIGKNIIRSFVLCEAADPPQLRSELDALGITFTDGSPLRIELGPREHAHTIIQRIRTPLTMLKIHEPTLEEAYIEIINQTSRAAEGGEATPNEV